MVVFDFWGEKFFPTMYQMLFPGQKLFCVMPGNLSRVSPTPSEVPVLRQQSHQYPGSSTDKVRQCRQIRGFAQSWLQGHLMWYTRG